MGGADVFLPMGAGVGFFANSSFALPFGPMKKEENYKYVDSDTKNRSAHYHTFNFQPTIEFGAGLDYKYWIYQKALVHIMLGWEFNVWFDLNQFGNADTELGHAEDSIIAAGEYFWLPPNHLIYQGLTLRLGLDY